jgi:hypothetical protein
MYYGNPESVCPITTDQNLATQIILYKIDDPDPFFFCDYCENF